MIDSLSSLTLENSTLDANQAEIANGSGGGLYNQGKLTLVNGSFFKNSAGAGGGLLNERGGTIAITNGSFLENSASRTAGGIFSWTAGVTTQNTILSSSTRGGNCGGSPFADGSTANFSTDNSCTPGYQQVSPEELRLKFQGAVLVLPPGSIAIDKGSSAACPAVDQGLSPRSIDGNGDGIASCDAGANEYLPIQTHLYMPLVANQAGFSTPE
mgnify:FL=1